MRFTFACLAVLLVACGDGSSDSAATGSGGSGSGPSSGSFTTSGSGQNEDGCVDAARSVYLLGKGRELVRFDPGAMTFDQVGEVACPVSGGPAVGVPTPFSMAVDRGGIAWVLYSDGTVYKVDVTDASCTSTEFVPNQLEAFELFGMGFVTDTKDGSSETLYVSSYSPGDGIGKIDADLAIRRVGFYDKLPGAAELTGTGDARLYGFFADNPPRVARIDKGSADILQSVDLPDTQIGAAWAFAFWGGAFWLFTAPDGGSSRVDRLDAATFDLTEAKADIGLQVVGAGVSTCAPVDAPK
ncbi:MAG TPA: hypothetical protein VL400_01045 [Polyangiaceae bacterium]|nr:hypothetical protein [Polyangiaceae bacterium]